MAASFPCSTNSMAANIKLCAVPEDVEATLRKFRFRKAKNNAAIIMKINVKQMVVEVEDELEDVSISDIADELPEFQPRFIAYSYCYDHGDGRLSYPLMFISYSPAGVKPETNMIYAGSRTHLVNVSDITKVFEVREAEEMTEEWLKSKLNFFG